MFPPIERRSHCAWRCQRVANATLHHSECPASDVRDLKAARLTRTLGSKMGTGNSMTPVPLFDLRYLTARTATVVGARNRRHQQPRPVLTAVRPAIEYVPVPPGEAAH